MITNIILLKLFTIYFFFREHVFYTCAYIIIKSLVKTKYYTRIFRKKKYSRYIQTTLLINCKSYKFNEIYFKLKK
jgi:hypothetical protein